MRASFGLPSVSAEDAAEGEKWKKRAIQVRFEVPYFTVSGIQVRYLKVIEKSGYPALPWVRYICQSGDYQREFGGAAAHWGAAAAWPQPRVCVV